MFRSCKQPPEDREVELCSTNKRKDSLKRDREEDEEEEDEAVPLLGGAPMRRFGSVLVPSRLLRRRPAFVLSNLHVQEERSVFSWHQRVRAEQGKRLV